MAPRTWQDLCAVPDEHYPPALGPPDCPQPDCWATPTSWIVTVIDTLGRWSHTHHLTGADARQCADNIARYDDPTVVALRIELAIPRRAVR